MGHFAASVTVVTARLQDGSRAGITVTAFASLSLDPPLVLVCIDHRARLHDELRSGGYFAVNILQEDQELVSRRFASSQGDQFQDVGATEGATGSPLITGALACIECRVVDRLPGGDHTIVIGEVESTQINEGKPLVYFRGGYAQLS
jgi:flavin reductase (DIM6/NTAB) family NADH-FMN oxidoreductase RutF